MEDLFNLLNQQQDIPPKEGDIKNLLVNQTWVLVNKIKDEKTFYFFHDDNKLTRTTNGSTSKAQWHYVNANYIRITSNGEINVIKMNFRDEDILTLDIDRHSNSLAVFINETRSNTSFNTYDDITNYLHDKYVNKAKNIINKHQYYYIEQSEEYGPVTAEYLIKRVEDDSINAQCLIRDINDYDYSKRLRIQDLIDVI